MKLLDVLRDIPLVRLSGSDQADIQGIAYASARVEPGWLFAALKGLKQDGLDFVPEAVKNGAAAVLCDRPKPRSANVAWAEARDARLALALAAANFYDHPSRKLAVLGVTGTKGKTTVTHLLESILREAGFRPGVLGTIAYRGPGLTVTADRTTPEAPDIQRFLRRMLDSGATHALLEVSSHALDLKRVWAVQFDVAIFTNLSGEHLDYHPTMEDYFEAKKKLFFLNSKSQTAVVNIDDPYGRRLLHDLPLKTISFGCAPEAIVRASKVVLDRRGLRATFDYPGGRTEVSSPLMGRHNLYNILAAFAAGLAFNVPPAGILSGIASLRGVPGRLESVDNGRGLMIFVDYAHTDSALRHLLETARGLEGGRVLLVFGAGGDRDKSKRERMGEAAAELADWTFITSDNPRSEEPAAILADIEKGFLKRGAKNFSSLVDRREAITQALHFARQGDIVLVAGKGHEDYQEVKGKRYPFSDAAVIRELLGEEKQTEHG
ncbi:MAG: UDP-N-acetylmuramoyl-L-alanyl-D-glutamate--2,6-diaminopimelate ligase [Candidatus Aminicenantes bacterium]|nr:UDP-N-acetylmuramoyl-L-alanyl-D-glutamate--2,6-diaminopimelate ligase [Candidatus Aminicenantes bacterium]MBM3312842.1 UDP-N-acetylmuramoyl-L-alanyl-D-glutamate--2,6-diaminopimelate ligase [Candidatus Aminicenantes bacterium]